MVLWYLKDLLIRNNDISDWCESRGNKKVELSGSKGDLKNLKNLKSLKSLHLDIYILQTLSLIINFLNSHGQRDELENCLED